MEPDHSSEAELTFEQKVQMLTSILPKPVQDFLHSPERNAVSLELSRKYALHADQAGVFEQAYIYMLLGVYTPDEFVQELRDAHIPEETVRALTTDVNERVFKKLQGAERNPVPVPAPFSPPVPPKPAPAAIPIYVPPVQAPAPVLPAPAISAPSPFTPPPVSMPVPPPAAPMPPKPVFAAPPAPQPMEHSAVRTMASDMQMMKGGSPARTFQTSSVPNTVPAPQPVMPPPAPVAPPTPPAPSAARPFSMPTPPPNLPGQPAGTHPASIPSTPIVKEYGVDPYREMPD